MKEPNSSTGRDAVTRHVILDRDGVLNREMPDGAWMHRVEDWQWEPNALDGLCRLAAAGVRISVATNQSGVGRGIFPVADVDRVHDRMLSEAAAAGAHIDAVFFCPHAPEDQCRCRKPGPGLVEAAVEQSGIPVAETILVGDALRDLHAAIAAGVRAILVRTGKGRATEAQLDDSGQIAVYDDLLSVSMSIVPITERPR
jgi:D-glycero-D-manno-heptose 1,7-bisphosphate phosphatase